MFTYNIQGFIRFFLSIALVSIIVLNPCLSQADVKPETSVTVSPDSISNNSIREEIQRYFGYEDLLFRYMTIPYDISQGVNQLARHVDIGFAFLALWPILILILVYRNKKLFYSFLSLFVIYLLLAWNFSHLRMPDQSIIQNDGEKWNSVKAHELESLSSKFLFGLYDGAYLIVGPLRNLLNQITGPKDHITYPILLILFIGSLYGITSMKKLTRRVKTLSIITISYGFLWWILGGGIIWYGMLLFPLGYALILRSYSRIKFQVPEELIEFSRNVVLIVLVIWVFMAYVNRISYVEMTQVHAKNSGQQIENQMLMLYSTGLISAEECREISAQNVAQGIRRINSDNRYVYQVGTHLVFDIENNHKRVFEDNTLSFVFDEMSRLDNPRQIVKRLKDRGFGYILLDLNTHLLDRTPEKSLVRKYQVFLQQLYRNPDVQLVATDREVIVKNEQGQKVRVNAVIGEEYPKPGNYAIYEIL